MRGHVKRYATQMAGILALAASVRTTGCRLATDNIKGTVSPLLMLVAPNGAEGENNVCVSEEFNLSLLNTHFTDVKV